MDLALDLFVHVYLHPLGTYQRSNIWPKVCGHIAIPHVYIPWDNLQDVCHFFIFKENMSEKAK